MGILTFVLWLATIAIGLWEIAIVQELLIRLYVRFGRDYWTAVAIRNWIVLPLSAAWLVFAIFSGEYHREKVGQRASWRLLGFTFAAEAAILILALLF
ncbi:MAG: hypothetical protein RML36_08605 [Anaerolineae bacterium]|nr:hypothetical protein [Anaerolineae bacterium]